MAPRNAHSTSTAANLDMQSRLSSFAALSANLPTHDLITHDDEVYRTLLRTYKPYQLYGVPVYVLSQLRAFLENHKASLCGEDMLAPRKRDHQMAIDTGKSAEEAVMHAHAMGIERVLFSMNVIYELV